MLRILVADDEPRQRKVLAGIIRKYRPADDIVECKNGEEALELLKEHPADAIFTDIRMPKVDGLELMEAVGLRQEKIKTIIISGYNYFEYAQRAITLGAFDYILKPIEETRIRDTITKIVNEIETEKSRQVHDVELAKQLSQTMPAYFEYLMNKWVTGALTNAQQSELARLLPHDNNGIFLCTVIHKSTDEGGAYDGDELAELEQNIHYWMGEMLSGYGRVYSFNSIQRERTILTVLFPYRDDEVLDEALEAQMKRVAAIIRDEYKAEVSIGMDAMERFLFQNAPQACMRAEKACEYRFFMGPGSVIRYSAIESNLTHQTGFVHFAEENALSDAIAAGDREKARHAVDLIFDRILAIWLPEVDTLKNMLSRMMETQAHNIRALVEPELFNELALTIRTDFDRSRPENMQDLKTLCLAEATMIMEMSGKSKSNRHEPIIRKCLEYINEHYAEDISLETLSRQFFFNPSYFSIYFKKYTKLKLSDYLPAVRMNKAKELLVNTDHKIYEIAGMVGYHDSRYFNLIFKKLNHITPAEYRKFHSIQYERDAQ